jgi:hypothetical protein
MNKTTTSPPQKTTPKTHYVTYSEAHKSWVVVNKATQTIAIYISNDEVTKYDNKEYLITHSDIKVNL